MVNDSSIDFQIHKFHEGTNFNSYSFLGSRVIQKNDIHGTVFRVWAPNAEKISVVGDFNNWSSNTCNMKKISSSGIWELFIPNISEGTIYKYNITTKTNDTLMKCDPYAFYSELRPNTASIVYNIESYDWNDSKWINRKITSSVYEQPINIYELHLGSWMRKSDNSVYNFKEIVFKLVNYIKNMGYTHVELLPVCEHPLDASWGYQTTGYYSITSRYGTPDDFKFLIDSLHQNNIGVILDWVPGHFCKDDHGLYKFDGSHLFEYSNPILGENYDWGTANFDLSKKEIHSFLISNAYFFFNEYHIDGLRVDAVSNMLYLNYGKKSNLSIKNRFGGIENIHAVEFIKKLNTTIFEHFNSPLMIAEESTAWPCVTRPTYLNGLGFNYKWNMGWMNDMLKYVQLSKDIKKFNHDLITFSIMYAFSENYILPLSHDEVVHGKKSLLNKMPGSYEEKFSSLRMFYGYMMAYPGKKLLFMGGEFGQFIEWKYNTELDWTLLQYPKHNETQTYLKELNNIYKNENSLWELDLNNEGFKWIDYSNSKENIISFIRKSKTKNDFTVVICNFSDISYEEYEVKVPRFTAYKEILNSDANKYGGTNMLNKNLIHPIKKNCDGFKFSINIKLPALSTVYLKPVFKDELVQLQNEYPI